MIKLNLEGKIYYFYTNFISQKEYRDVLFDQKGNVVACRKCQESDGYITGDLIFNDKELEKDFEFLIVNLPDRTLALDDTGKVSVIPYDSPSGLGSNVFFIHSISIINDRYEHKWTSELFNNSSFYVTASTSNGIEAFMIDCDMNAFEIEFKKNNDIIIQSKYSIANPKSVRSAIRAYLRRLLGEHIVDLM